MMNKVMVSVIAIGCLAMMSVAGLKAESTTKPVAVMDTACVVVDEDGTVHVYSDYDDVSGFPYFDPDFNFDFSAFT